jgi:hypothetical protein
VSITRAVAISGFVLAMGLFVAVEWAARREGSRVPTLGDLCGHVMRAEVGRVPVGRIVLLVFWWWIGWHFLAR